MAVYVGLFRGINVGRAHRVPMCDLRRLLETIGCREVQTLLNSGNAIFEIDSPDRPFLAHTIHEAVQAAFGFAAPVIVTSASELDRIVRGNPLAETFGTSSKHLVAFVAHREDLTRAESLRGRAWDPEAIAVGADAAYLWCANGVTASPLVQAFFEQVGQVATTRTWATVLKLHAAARARERALS